MPSSSTLTTVLPQTPTPIPVPNDTPVYNWTHEELFDNWINDLDTPDIPVGEVDHFNFDETITIDESQPQHNPDETEDLSIEVGSLVTLHSDDIMNGAPNYTETDITNSEDAQNLNTHIRTTVHSILPNYYFFTDPVARMDLLIPCHVSYR